MVWFVNLSVHRYALQWLATNSTQTICIILNISCPMANEIIQQISWCVSVRHYHFPDKSLQYYRAWGNSVEVVCCRLHIYNPGITVVKHPPWWNGALTSSGISYSVLQCDNTVYTYTKLRLQTLTCHTVLRRFSMFKHVWTLILRLDYIIFVICSTAQLNCLYPYPWIKSQTALLMHRNTRKYCRFCNYDVMLITIASLKTSQCR